MHTHTHTHSPYDQIVEVNGISLLNKLVIEARTIFARLLPGDIQLKLIRPSDTEGVKRVLENRRQERRKR